MMRRRDFITLVAGASTAWPLAARAQQAVMPVIGFLSGVSPNGFTYLTAAFREGLRKTGFVEDQNVAIEYRWTEGRAVRLPALLADLMGRRLAVITLTGGVGDSPFAANVAKSTIPVVFLTGGDPVKLGLVPSLNRPGGNVTGVSFFLSVLGAKRLELLRELVPSATLIAMLLNPHFPDFAAFLKDVETAAVTLGRQVHVLNASTEAEIDVAFATLADHRAGALLVSPDPFFLSRREQIVTLAKHYAVPAIYQLREFPAVLMSYGTSITDAYRQVGIYAGQILRGEKPSDLPVVQPTKFDLVINLATAKGMGLDIPPMLLARADEVIE